MESAKRTNPPLLDPTMIIKNRQSFEINAKTMAVPNVSTTQIMQGVTRPNTIIIVGGGKEGKSWLNKNTEKVFAKLINKSVKEQLKRECERDSDSDFE